MVAKEVERREEAGGMRTGISANKGLVFPPAVISRELWAVDMHDASRFTGTFYGNELLDVISPDSTLARNSSCISIATRVAGIGAWREMDE